MTFSSPPSSSSSSSSSHVSPTSQSSPKPPMLRLRKSLIRPFHQTDAAALAKEANNHKIARWMRNTFPHPYGVEDAVKWINFATATSSSPMLNFAICQLVVDNKNNLHHHHNHNDNNPNHNHNHDNPDHNPDDYNNNDNNNKEEAKENDEKPPPPPPTTSTVIGGIGLRPFPDIYHRTMQIGYWLGEAHWNQGIITEAIGCFAEWMFEQECFAHVVRLEAEVFEGNDASGRALVKAGFVCEGECRNAIEKDGVVMGLKRYVRFREG